MPRAATGTVVYAPPKKGEAQGHYRVRITLPDGKRPWIDRKPGPKSPRAEKLAREYAIEASETSRSAGMIGADFLMRAKPLSTKAPAETMTVAGWFDAYFRWKEARPTGGESVGDARGRFKNWVAPILGAIPMVDVTRDDIEALVSKLDEAVSEKRIAGKTALNIFSDVRAGFGVATSGKEKTLRVLRENPARDVAPPDQTPDRAKTFLRPDEVMALLSCGRVPLDRRQIYAVAMYTAMRQGELRAVRVRDVDLDVMQITVARTIKNGREKQKTKTGRLRVVQIEPNLVPLLRILMSGKNENDRLLLVRAHNRCAISLRADLTIAGCTRDAIHTDDEMRQHLTFHNLRDTCLTHMAVRRDPPQDVQWRAGHTTPAMTEKYIANARYQAGANFGTPLGPLPKCILVPDVASTRDDDGGDGESGGDDDESHHDPVDDERGPIANDVDGRAESSQTPSVDRPESSAAIVSSSTVDNDHAVTNRSSTSRPDKKRMIAANSGNPRDFRFPAPPPRSPCFSGGSSPNESFGCDLVPNVTGLRDRPRPVELHA